MVDLNEQELQAYAEGMAESVPKNAPESDFADPPSGLYVGDAQHVHYAVQAVTSGLRGNKAKARSEPGVKSKIASAVRRFYKGDEQKYYLSWLRTGKKPDKKPASEAWHEMQYIATPVYSVDDETRFPEVPINPRVNLQELLDLRHDDKPVFVTRPLAILDEVSQNGLPYNQAVYDAIHEQVLSKSLVARRGHISEADRSSAFPPDDGYWVGIVEDSTFYGKPALFGKCYVVPGTMREIVLSRKATRTSLSNSLWGDVAKVDDEPVSVNLESIDFVPEERAALQALGGAFVVTSEMTKGTEPMAEHDDAAADLELFKKAVASIKPEVIHECLHEAGRAHEVATHHVAFHEKGGNCIGSMHEMFSREARAKLAESHLREEATPEETYNMLSAEKRAHVAEAYAKETGKSMTSMSETKKTNDALAEMSTRVSEMEKTIKAYQRADFERALDGKIDAYFVAEMHTGKGKEVLGNLKRQMRKSTLAEMAGMSEGQIVGNIDAACEKVWTEDMKALTEMAYAGLTGPAAVVTPPKPANAGNRMGIDPTTGRFTPEFLQQARDAAAGAMRTKGGAK